VHYGTRIRDNNQPAAGQHVFGTHSLRRTKATLIYRDPVGFGLVTSLNRPGGNVTGVSLFTSELEVKKFALLRELARV
jgi:hypothetical protein